ncbi:hypothetical protein K6W36_09095 [Acetobacter senegalensis]|uniref:hypothetical protein n=1 Tax=Acetobacter senegalensis TaxID=446692 RepID=UPI001EDC09B0|nr:hypothetical protein [Acetobacter senegalensis]MCG4260741.1 hypothetical protein [Acetobacter senegalensis]
MAGRAKGSGAEDLVLSLWRQGFSYRAAGIRAGLRKAEAQAIIESHLRVRRARERNPDDVHNLPRRDGALPPEHAIPTRALWAGLERYRGQSNGA